MANEAGAGCSVRGSVIDNYTFVSKSSPASLAGNVSRLAFYKASVAADPIHFAFFTASGDSLTTVSGTRVSGLTAATGDGCVEFNSPGDFSEFAVSSGDYLGCYASDDQSYKTSTGSGIWYKSGDQTNVSGVSFTDDADGIDSLTADITASGGGTTVTGTTGAIVITGISASVSAGTSTTITATTGSVSIAGINSDISAGKTISATTGAVVIQGVNASVSAGAMITATTGAISINGINATVTNDGSIIVTTGALVIQGITASISAGTTITATTGAVVIQSINAIVENIRTITTTTGTLSITGVNVVITSSVVIDATTGAVIILGFDVSIQSGPTAVTPPERIYNIPKTNRVNTIKATNRVNTIKATRRVYTIT